MGFPDYFSAVAPDYARFRPAYPRSFLAQLAALAPARRRAWDCATGSGQAAVRLAREFSFVVATDASRDQIAAARRHPRVGYAVARAEASALATGCADLVTVAQALHWFDRPAFYAEAARVLAPGGVLAVFCYGLMEIAPAIDTRVRAFYSGTLGPFWPQGRGLVEGGYRDVEFPFDETPAPDAAIEASLTLRGLAGYLGTWSAVRRFAAERGIDPVPELIRSIEDAWGRPGSARRVRWRLHARVGRTPVQR